jgi:hypothetical protein
VALISGRTADNPRLLGECIAKGCKCIYLEKPGAPTVKELEEMKAEAEEAGIEVLMGYNKVSLIYNSKKRLCVQPVLMLQRCMVQLCIFFVLKNVCKYVRKTREFAETVPGSHVTFVSNNAYE